MKLKNKHIKILQEVNLPLLLMLQEAEELNSDDEPQANEEGPKQAAEQQQQAQQQQAQQQAAADEQAQQQQAAADEQAQKEQLFNAELVGAQSKFVQFVIYDKLSDLSDKIEIMKDQLQINDVDYDLQFSDKLDKYSQYIEVLNELIFSVSVSTIYNIVGQLEIELIQLMEDYVKFHNIQSHRKIIRRK